VSPLNEDAGRFLEHHFAVTLQRLKSGKFAVISREYFDSSEYPDFQICVSINDISYRGGHKRVLQDGDMIELSFCEGAAACRPLVLFDGQFEL